MSEAAEFLLIGGACRKERLTAGHSLLRAEIWGECVNGWVLEVTAHGVPKNGPQQMGAFRRKFVFAKSKWLVSARFFA